MYFFLKSQLHNILLKVTPLASTTSSKRLRNHWVLSEVFDHILDLGHHFSLDVTTRSVSVFPNLTSHIVIYGITTGVIINPETGADEDIEIL